MECSNPGITGYYRLHAGIYDATRWSFLFDRARLLDLSCAALIAAGREHGARVAEVGCGTGRNLRALARMLPTARLTGLDLCPPMLARARKATATAADRVTLACGAYGPDSLGHNSQDLIVFSYALSMFNPGFEAAVAAARLHVRPGGIVAAVDFCDSPRPWFRAWMGVNHVRLDGHLPPVLAARFGTVRCETTPAYGGLWRHFCFLGRKDSVL